MKNLTEILGKSDRLLSRTAISSTSGRTNRRGGLELGATFEDFLNASDDGDSSPEVPRNAPSASHFSSTAPASTFATRRSATPSSPPPPPSATDRFAALGSFKLDQTTGRFQVVGGAQSNRDSSVPTATARTPTGCPASSTPAGTAEDSDAVIRASRESGGSLCRFGDDDMDDRDRSDSLLRGGNGESGLVGRANAPGAELDRDDSSLSSFHCVHLSILTLPRPFPFPDLPQGAEYTGIAVPQATQAMT